MGTISDKLMRIINTKEDIRQALILKGYDVPTSIPFKEYAKMISDLPCKVDDFPKLPGDVTRWHFGGLTNEMMAAMDDPRIEDADHKGRFLSFKNFAWKGMSGVGGYAGDFSKWRNNRDTTEIGITKSNLKVIIDVKVSQGAGKNIVFINKSDLGISNNVTIKITSTYPEGVMKFANSASNKYLKLPSNGVITLQDNPEYTRNEMYLHLGSADLGQITIEQLPLYPGFILGDGVDDFAVTEKELNFEDTYTVYTAFIPFQNNPTRNMILCGKNDTKDFSINYSGTHLNFKPSTGVNLAVRIDQFALLVCKRNKDITTIINLSTGESRSLKSVEFISNPGLYYLWRNMFATFYAKAAIAGQIIDNGHFTTDEEDENILNWHKKQYPWLFPDQAWTVTGKTNEDADRDTIANITGNGNDLILSNFGFIEGSGYNEEGEYAGYLVTDGVDDKVQSSSFTMNEDWTIVGDWELLSNVQINCGIVKAQNVYLYNTANGLLISINNPRSLQSFGTKSLHAICSDGRLYDRNWVEYEYTVDQNFEIVKSSLNIGFNLNNYTQIAFKNLGIYNNQILSKDDCIKAYNYLQTLKSK